MKNRKNNNSLTQKHGARTYRASVFAVLATLAFSVTVFADGDPHESCEAGENRCNQGG